MITFSLFKWRKVAASPPPHFKMFPWKYNWLNILILQCKCDGFLIFGTLNTRLHNLPGSLSQGITCGCQEIKFNFTSSFLLCKFMSSRSVCWTVCTHVIHYASSVILSLFFIAIKFWFFLKGGWWVSISPNNCISTSSTRDSTFFFFVIIKKIVIKA